jgi:hypothetical protein
VYQRFQCRTPGCMQFFKFEKAEKNSAAAFRTL